MTNEEKVTLDIELAGEFLQYLIDNPSELEKIPNGCSIRFVDNFENIKTVNGEKKILNVRKTYEYV